MPFATRGKERAVARFAMRLSTEDYARLCENADLAGLSISEFVRRRAFQRPVQSATDLVMIRELRRLGGLQKFLVNKAIQDKMVVDECIATIKALRAAIERVASHDR